MAILEGVPGIQVSIRSLDHILQEYDEDGEETQNHFTHVSSERYSSKFVECQTGAEFQIETQLHSPFQLDCQSITFKASVDGHRIAQCTCTGQYFVSNYSFYKMCIDARLDRISPTQMVSRTLKFTAIKKVDDLDSNRVKNDAKLVDGIGEIVVSVFRTEELNEPRSSHFSMSQYKPPEEVAEKALKGKAISHGVAYGEQHIVSRLSKRTIDLDGPDNPIAVFVFKYRSRADLQAELILPRSPSPEPQASFSRSRTASNGVPLSRDARLANLKREIKEIKAEEDEENRPRKRGRESDIVSSGRAYRTSQRPDGNVVVDLTDD